MEWLWLVRQVPPFFFSVLCVSIVAEEDGFALTGGLLFDEDSSNCAALRSPDEL